MTSVDELNAEASNWDIRSIIEGNRELALIVAQKIALERRIESLDRERQIEMLVRMENKRSTRTDAK